MLPLKQRELLVASLTTGTHQLGLTLSDHQHQQLIDYLVLLEQWNRIYNLTAVRDIHKMVSMHLLDSLAIMPYVVRSPLLDIGSGAGLPGIPLAIALPQYQFVLLECQQKRTRFLNQVVATLSLANVQVVNQRIETYQSNTLFYAVTARAVASCAELVSISNGLLAKTGQWLLLKGAVAADEYANLPKNTQFDSIIMLTVPGVEQQRRLVQIKKISI